MELSFLSFSGILGLSHQVVKIISNALGYPCADSDSCRKVSKCFLCNLLSTFVGTAGEELIMGSGTFHAISEPRVTFALLD